MSVSRLIYLAVILQVLCGMSPHPTGNFSEELVQRLSGRYHVSYSEGNSIILKDRSSGFEQLYKLSNLPSTQENFNQIIDLTQVDTADFSQVFTLIDTILLAGAHGAYPLVIDDIDHDRNLDFSGSYKYNRNHEPLDCGVFELQSNNKFEKQAIYKDNVHNVVASCDFDKDGLKELLFRLDHTDTLACYESKTPDSYPDSSVFLYPMGTGEINHETMVDADNDGEMDVIHKGKQNDKIGMCVAEYDPIEKRLERTFYHQSDNGYHWGLSYGDYDNDGYLEFVTATTDAEVYIYENQGNDNYSFIRKIDLQTLNAYLNCSTNDIDGNGKIEFFIGGLEFYDSYQESRVYWFEASGDNEYEVKYSFILRGVDGLGLTELYNYDVNADGVDDLVFCYMHNIVILIWNRAGYFDLTYYSQADYDAHDFKSINVFDVYNEGMPNLIESLYNRHPAVPYECSKIYRNNLVLGIQKNPRDDIPKTFRLHQNYPNPFNGSTSFNFELDRSERVSLNIYDINGKEVNSLLSNVYITPGDHKYTWDGKNFSGEEVSSGIYFLSLQAGHNHSSIKMIFTK